MKKIYWEKGERVWGYYLDEKRIAKISLSPKLPGKEIFYTLEIDVMYCDPITFDDLQKAKRCAEKILIDITSSI